MKKLLIVVDYQKDFVNGSLGFKEAEYLDEYLASLIDQYHQNKDDVIFTFIHIKKQLFRNSRREEFAN